jgi:hypothetical protein
LKQLVSAIEAPRAFDLVHVINKGTNGLELVSVLVTNNIVGEPAASATGPRLS